MLAEAGYAGGRGLPVLEALVPSGERTRPLGAYLKAHWSQELGVETSWEFEDWELLEERKPEEQPHITFEGWTADYPDPDNILRVMVRRVVRGWQDEAYEQLLDEARQLLDQKERMALYRQADRILVEGAPLLLLGYHQLHWLVKPWVTKYPLSPMRDVFAKDVIIEPH